MYNRHRYANSGITLSLTSSPRLLSPPVIYHLGLKRRDTCLGWWL